MDSFVICLLSPIIIALIISGEIFWERRSIKNILEDNEIIVFGANCFGCAFEISKGIEDNWESLKFKR